MVSGLKVALTHDVDRVHKTYHYLTYLLKAIRNRDVESVRYQLSSIKAKGHFWNFEDIIDFEDSCGIKSTFYFLNESIKFRPFHPSNWPLSLGRYNIEDERMVRVIKAIDAAGWEIGVHGSYLSYQNGFLLRKEKEVLERILGHQVEGIRQHYLNLSPTTWKLQQEAGFIYDTSLGFKHDIGFPRLGLFRPLGDHFIVYPQVIMDMVFMRNPAYNWGKLNDLIRKGIESDSIIVLNWHNNVFNEREFPDYFKTYKDIIYLLIKEGAHFDLLSNYSKAYDYN